jgi:hypothetical protein
MENYLITAEPETLVQLRLLMKGKGKAGEEAWKELMETTLSGYLFKESGEVDPSGILRLFARTTEDQRSVFLAGLPPESRMILDDLGTMVDRAKSFMDLGEANPALVSLRTGASTGKTMLDIIHAHPLKSLLVSAAAGGATGGSTGSLTGAVVGTAAGMALTGGAIAFATAAPYVIGRNILSNAAFLRRTLTPVSRGLAQFLSQYNVERKK